MEGEAYHALRDDSAPMPPTLSPDAQALLRAMLHSDPAVRPSACQILEHPLLAGRMREEANPSEIKSLIYIIQENQPSTLNPNP